MYSYTVQASKQSGETFVIEWDGDTINGLCGPLSATEREQAINDIADAGSFEYESYDGDTSPSAWQYPIASYDPETGEVHREGQHHYDVQTFGDMAAIIRYGFDGRRVDVHGPIPANEVPAPDAFPTLRFDSRHVAVDNDGYMDWDASARIWRAVERAQR